MKVHKMYEPEDKLISIIGDNYSVLQSLGSFGINLGFGDKTVREVCESQNVDTYTFLAIVNLTINGYKGDEDSNELNIPTLIQYLRAVIRIILIFNYHSFERNWQALWTKPITWLDSS